MRKALSSLVLSFIVFLQELSYQSVVFKSPRDKRFGTNTCDKCGHSILVGLLIEKHD